MPTIAAAVLLAVSANAQESKTAFFLDNCLYAWNVNPGTRVEGEPYRFFSIGLGNGSASLLASFYAPTINLGAVPSMFSSWSAFNLGLAQLGDLVNFGIDNRFLAGTSAQIFSFGRQWEDSRYSVSLNSRSDTRLNASFNFIRDFVLDLNGDLSNLSGTIGVDNVGFRSVHYLELCGSYTRNLGDIASVGGNVKLLLGYFGMGLDINTMRVGVFPDGGFGADLNAGMFFSSSVLTVPSTWKDGREVYDFSSARLGGLGFSGIGTAVDFGLNVQPASGLTLGLSVLDFGLMYWGGGFDARLDYSGRAVESKNEIFALEPGGRGSRFKMLNYDIHLSAQYRMPFYDGWSVGMLGTYQPYFREVRLGTAVTPVKYISLALSTAFNNFGINVGTALNVRLPGLSLYLATDSLNFSRRMTNVTAGLAIAFPG